MKEDDSQNNLMSLFLLDAMIHCLYGDKSSPCNVDDGLPNQLLGYGDGLLTVRSVKLVMDGALGSFGAAMIQPYNDNPSSTGIMRIPPAQLEGLIWRIMKQNYQVNIHCIGDLANKLALDSFESIYQRWDEVHGLKDAGKSFRNRIEHAQILRQEDIERFGAIGIIPSVQPTHATSDMSYAEKRLGRERVKSSYIWRSFLNGVGVPHLPLGSDFPIESVDPLKGIYAAVTRKNLNGSSPAGQNQGWFPNESLSRQQALKGFTLSAAYASHMELELGSISIGKYADFVVYDRDWISNGDIVDESGLLLVKPLATVVGGVVRFGSLSH